MPSPGRTRRKSQQQQPSATKVMGIFWLVLWCLICLAASFSLWQSVAAMRQSLVREAEAKQNFKIKKKKHWI